MAVRLALLLAACLAIAFAQSEPSIEVQEGTVVLTSANDVKFNISGTIHSLVDLTNSQELEDVASTLRNEITSRVASTDVKLTAADDALSRSLSQATSTLNAAISTSQRAVENQVSTLRQNTDNRVADLNSAQTILSISSQNLTQRVDNQGALISNLISRANAQEAIIAQQSALISTQQSTLAELDRKFEKRTADIIQELVPKAPNVFLRHIYSSIVTVTWDIPYSPITITGYEMIIFNTTSNRPLQTKTTSPDFREVTFDGLTTQTRYTISVAAVTAIGQGARGNWTGNTLVDDITAMAYSCKPSVWQVAAPPSATTICSIDIPLTGKSIVHGIFSGHASCPSPALYASVLIDENIGIDTQEIGPAHTYSTAWETVRSGRIRFIDKVGVIQARLVISSGTNCQLSGASLHVVVLNAHSPNFGRYGCVPSSGWGTTYTGGFVPASLCESTFNVTAPSLVQTFFNGHMLVPSGWVYGVVNYDNEVAARYGNAIDKQVLVPAHTYSTTWETFGSGRSTFLQPGIHKVAASIAAQNGASYNGAALQGFFMETKRDRTFLCTPSAWSVVSAGAPVVVCEVTLNVAVPSVIFAEFSGHAQCTTGSCYGLISINNDGIAALNAYGGDILQTKGAALTTLTVNWEMFGGARAAEVSPGTVLVSMMFRCNNRGAFNGGGVSGYIVPKA